LSNAVEMNSLPWSTWIRFGTTPRKSLIRCITALAQ
jgi:hypothetical protein